MNHFFITNGHVFYIVSAFGLSTMILILNLWLPLRKYRRIMQQSKQNESTS